MSGHPKPPEAAGSLASLGSHHKHCRCLAAWAWLRLPTTVQSEAAHAAGQILPEYRCPGTTGTSLGATLPHLSLGQSLN